MATIFEPMVRHPSSEATISTNLGLGLYIAHEVVVAHDGEITVTSTEKDGTLFQVRLPRTAKTKLAPVRDPAPVPQRESPPPMISASREAEGSTTH
jgi:K+-sensing histidine kinase KdpD